MARTRVGRDGRQRRLPQGRDLARERIARSARVAPGEAAIGTSARRRRRRLRGAHRLDPLVWRVGPGLVTVSTVC